MNIKHGLAVYKEGEPESVLHFCGYEEEPSEHDVQELFNELAEDEEFGLTEVVDSLVIRRCTQKEVEFVLNNLDVE